ncbi:50S ribosomal protein L15e [Candidatus Woesearchaeota archaeon]|nr:50S ribosomal protein L15e [Candidatus Woesearchaeota archaeon]
MGVFKYLSNMWRADGMPAELKRERLIKWRREPVTVRIDSPTRIDRARALGYHAKQGVFVVRQRVKKGSHKRPDWAGGRRSRNMGSRLMLNKNYKTIAEERASKKFANCEVLNSYYVLEDGKNYWFEVIMVDRAHPCVLSDKRTNWVLGQPGRVFRGLTSAARRSRGLHKKGKGSEKTRPSRKAHLK